MVSKFCNTTGLVGAGSTGGPEFGSWTGGFPTGISQNRVEGSGGGGGGSFIGEIPGDDCEIVGGGDDDDLAEEEEDEGVLGLAE